MKKIPPKFACSQFSPPNDLGDDERVVWQEITDILRDSKITKMSDADHELVRQYCQFTVVRNRAWEAYLQKPERYAKIVIGICSDKKTPKIALKDNEHYKTWIECNKHLELLLKEMELDPRSRKIPRSVVADKYN